MVQGDKAGVNLILCLLVAGWWRVAIVYFAAVSKRTSERRGELPKQTQHVCFQPPTPILFVSQLSILCIAESNATLA
jgi:hypothetical protein